MGVFERDSLTQHTGGTFKGVSLVRCRPKKWNFVMVLLQNNIFFIIYSCLDTAVCSNMDSESDYQHKAADVYKKGRVGVRVLVRVEQFGFPPHSLFLPLFLSLVHHLITLGFSASLPVGASTCILLLQSTHKKMRPPGF